MELPHPLAFEEQSLTLPKSTEQIRLPDISDGRIKSLVAEINNTGFAVLPGYLKPDELEELKNYAETAVAAAGGEYAGFDGKDKFEQTLLGDIGKAPEFLSLIHRVYEQGCGRAAPKQALYQVLRCLKGKSGLKHSLMFHYDSYFVTALLPIIIPSEGKAGHLVMAPNWRKLRSSYMANLIDKILLDNKLTQSLLRYAFNKGQLGLKQVAMVPGNLYFFWGYRTIHANEACDPDKIRATALFHFGDPHVDSGLRKFTGKAKARA